MKKKALYDLSKQQLYFMYQCLKSSHLDSHILDIIQYLDVKPSEILWDSYISATEHRVIHFDQSLKVIQMHRYFATQQDASTALHQLVGDNKSYLLFYNRENCILFSAHILAQILEATYFFEMESYVLYSLETQNILTGGWQGFTQWQTMP